MTINRRIRSMRMLAGSSKGSLCSLNCNVEVFLMPEGYRHDIQHPNQPLLLALAHLNSA